MPPKIDPENEPERNEIAAEGFAYMPPEKPERLSFYELPNYRADGRTDPRARGELVCTLPASDDYEEKFARLALPGWYCVELRRGGSIEKSAVLEIKPSVRSIAPEASLHPAMPAPTMDVEVLIERALTRQREEFERLLREREDEPRTPRTQAEDATQPRSLVEQMRELVEAAKVVENFKRNNLPAHDDRASAGEDAEDAESKTLLLLMKDPRVRERAINGLSSLISDEPVARSWIADAGEILANHGDKLAPLVGSLAGMFASSVGRPQPPQPPAQTRAPMPRTSPVQAQAPVPQPPVQPAPPVPASAEAAAPPATFESECVKTLEELLNDMDKNAPVKESANDVLLLMEEFPRESEQLQMLLQQDTAMILSLIAAQFPAAAAATSKPTAAKWIDRLKKAIAARRKTISLVEGNNL
jgi:hypothetical protein